MRIAGGAIRRNFLRNYELNSTSKFESEQKISTGRQFQRASENPINAAKALRVRKSMADLETHQKNLESADSIYQVAEDSLLTVSSLIQNTYEKLVQGAHGTYNQNDMDIIASEIEQYAEEMVQVMNVDVADRKIFGGTNNTTNAFEIKGAIGRITGKDEDGVTRIYNTFRALCNYADFNGSRNVVEQPKEEMIESKVEKELVVSSSQPQFHYNIQIHLPATTDISVYNAIFKSLKDNLLM